MHEIKYLTKPVNYSVIFYGRRSIRKIFFKFSLSISKLAILIYDPVSLLCETRRDSPETVQENFETHNVFSSIDRFVFEQHNRIHTGIYAVYTWLLWYVQWFLSTLFKFKIYTHMYNTGNVIDTTTDVHKHSTGQRVFDYILLRQHPRRKKQIKSINYY